MNVKELITQLKKIEDKELEIRIATPFDQEIEENLWLINEIYVHNTGMSGYEVEGEVEIHTTT